MKTKKIIGGVAAAVAMLGLSAIAQAEECAVVADDIEEVAFEYGCSYGEFIFFEDSRDHKKYQ